MRVATTLALGLLAACGTEQSSTSSSLTRAPGECGLLETHVIGVYDPGGDSTVVLQRPGKHVLVLSSYAATTWHIKAAPDAEIVHIYAVGYHQPHVLAPAGLDVKIESHDTGGAYACGYMLNASDGTCDTDGLLALAAKRIHHEATSFHGCYSASTWTIGADLGVTSDCRVDEGYIQSDAIERCDADDTDTSCGGGDGSGSGSGSDGGSGSGSGSGDGVVLY